MKSVYDAARSNRCSVSAPSVSFSVGGRMVIARQFWGKGSDCRGRSAAGPEESIGEDVGHARLHASPFLRETSDSSPSADRVTPSYGLALDGRPECHGRRGTKCRMQNAECGMVIEIAFYIHRSAFCILHF